MTLLAEAVLPIITGGGTCRIKKPLGRWLKSKQYTGSLEPLPTQGIFHPSNFMMYCKELFILRHGKLWSCLGSRAVSALHLTKGWSNPTVQVFLTLCWTLKRRGSMTEVFLQAFLTPLLRNKRFEKTHPKRCPCWNMFETLEWQFRGNETHIGRNIQK